MWLFDLHDRWGLHYMGEYELHSGFAPLTIPSWHYLSRVIPQGILIGAIAFVITISMGKTFSREVRFSRSAEVVERLSGRREPRADRAGQLFAARELLLGVSIDRIAESIVANQQYRRANAGEHGDLRLGGSLHALLPRGLHSIHPQRLSRRHRHRQSLLSLQTRSLSLLSPLTPSFATPNRSGEPRAATSGPSSSAWSVWSRSERSSDCSQASRCPALCCSAPSARSARTLPPRWRRACVRATCRRCDARSGCTF